MAIAIPQQRAKKRVYKILYVQVLFAIALGIVLGRVRSTTAPGPRDPSDDAAVPA
jgi:hypothetical protein